MGYPSPRQLSSSMPPLSLHASHKSTRCLRMHVCDLPEEILETILSLVVTAPLAYNLRPTWHHPSLPASAGTVESCPGTRSRQSILFVCKLLSRISIPLFYHTIHIHNPQQARHLARKTFRYKPEIAGHVRRLILAGAWSECGEVLQVCALAGNQLRVLDFILNFNVPFVPGSQSGNTNSARNAEQDSKTFSEGLKMLKDVRQLTVRKPDNTYLSQKGIKGAIEGLAHALEGWDLIEYVDCAFRISDDAPGSLPSLSVFAPSSVFPPPPPPHTTQSSRFSSASPIIGASTSAYSRAAVLPHSARLPQRAIGKPTTPNALLIHSLQSRPHLRTFCTRLPNTWNECLLRLSENVNLERIVLVDPLSQQGFQAKDFYAAPVGACYPDSGNILGQGQGHGQVLIGPGPTGLYMMQARRYPRLCELIGAGTFIMRTRAQTLGSATPPSTPPPAASNKSFAESQMSPNSPAAPTLTRPSSSQPIQPAVTRSLGHENFGLAASATTQPVTDSITPFSPTASSSQSPKPPPLSVRTRPTPATSSASRFSYHHPIRDAHSPTSHTWQHYPSFAVNDPSSPTSASKASYHSPTTVQRSLRR